MWPVKLWCLACGTPHRSRKLAVGEQWQLILQLLPAAKFPNSVRRITARPHPLPLFNHTGARPYHCFPVRSGQARAMPPLPHTAGLGLGPVRSQHAARLRLG